MKLTFSILLTITLLLTLSACNSRTQKTCYNCNESFTEETNFCPNCGTNLISSDNELETEQEPIDYSDFGFQNNYGMTKWIEFEKYDFSDKNNAYICVLSNDYNVISFNHNTRLETHNFSEEILYEGNAGEIELKEYAIISNELIEFYEGAFDIWTITKISTEHGVPIINSTYDNNEHWNFLFIPVDFIDWSRNLEFETVPNPGAPGTVTSIKYYIKPELLT